ncbi:MAG: FAD-dependent oxidoreductase [Candidatus Hydrogenedentes bacterium]|jgi:NADPH-dependent 2,4-dienoyl-CoA reductase/sulfur reductase-like enzyme/peroxiredoxin family protein/TusA-related sulfurtransferase/rhodanese-related sulfurtransferase|nr:FAD-dependent oxidoreductase [Candidatus Hydrogenedentota bacterium]
MAKKIVIVGGVAGGMSCAARIKRLDESTEVTVFEKGEAVSFANCGLPYYVGGVISNRADMIVQSATTLKGRYGLDIKTGHEVTRIDPVNKEVEVTDLKEGKSFKQPYDELVLATGAEPIRPNIPGVKGSNVYTLNNLNDMDGIKEKAQTASKACVIGAGFIGLELAENLRMLGLDVVLVEMLDQILPPLDPEMTIPLLQELQMNSIDVRLKSTVTAIDDKGVTLQDGTKVEADLVCLCAGVAPRSALAREAGLTVGPRGHIVVNTRMQSSDASVYAVGDAVQTCDRLTGEDCSVPLAGPANRQGRIAADNICGRSSVYPGVLGTSIVKIFNQSAASTGWSEKRLSRAGKAYFRVYIHPMQHAKYYPGAVPVSIKGLFSPEGVLLGAQVVGPDDVNAAVDVLAIAVTQKMTASDLENLELAYSPQYDSAKSMINMLGFTAQNIINGDVVMIEPDQLDQEDLYWLDVRMPEEAECGVIPGTTIIPMEELRYRYDELPRDKKIGAYCTVGLRGYLAYRQLIQAGFDVVALNGGYRTWCWFQNMNGAQTGIPCASLPACGEPCDGIIQDSPSNTITLDVSGLQCPGPLARVKQSMTEMAVGDILEVIATDVGFMADIPAWCNSTGNSLLETRPEGNSYKARIRKGNSVPTVAAVQKAVAPDPVTKKGKTIVCFSDDLDRVMATFVIANGAAAMDSDVTIFFTFWGINVLRKTKAPPVSKGLLDRMFGMMMPKGPGKLSLSKMNMGGMGSMMMRHVMKKKQVMTPEELVAAAQASGVRLVVCSMSMDVMGIKKEELIDGIEIGGVGAFLGRAEQADVNLFI